MRLAVSGNCLGGVVLLLCALRLLKELTAAIGGR